MPSFKKYYTPDEANRALPLVRRIAEDIAATYSRLMENSELAGSAGPEKSHGLDAAHREELREVFERIEADKALLEGYIEELDRLGVQLKGPLDGLVDFPAWRMGEVVLLCWKLGEPEVAHWHDLESGFRGRKAIEASEFKNQDLPAPTDGVPSEGRQSRKDKQWNSSRST